MNVYSYFATGQAVADYFTARGFPIIGGADGESIADRNERLLALAKQASSYVDTFRDNFQGEKADKTFSDDKHANQLLEWPRSGVIVSGVSIPDDVVPDIILQATAQVIMRLIRDENPYGDWFYAQSASSRSSTDIGSGGLRREKFGSVEFEYYHPNEHTQTQQSVTPVAVSEDDMSLREFLAPVLTHASGIGTAQAIRTL